VGNIVNIVTENCAAYSGVWVMKYTKPLVVSPLYYFNYYSFYFLWHS